MDVRIKISKEEFTKEFNIYVEAKQQAMKELYHTIADKYKIYMKQVLPTENQEVLKLIKYRIKPTKHDIKLLLGILFDDDLDRIGDYFKWLLYGSPPHWVSLKRHPKVLEWALRHNVIQEVGGKYYFEKKPLYYSSGTPKSTRAVMVSSPGIAKYIIQVQNRLVQELYHEMVNLMKEK